jgi:hypothetical protein
MIGGRQMKVFKSKSVMTKAFLLMLVLMLLLSSVGCAGFRGSKALVEPNEITPKSTIIWNGKTLQDIESDLLDIFASDQEVRVRLIAAMEEGSPDFPIIMQEMMEIGAYNSVYVDSLLSDIGWPEGLSERADTAIFLVVQHAIHIQSKFFPMFNERAERGLIDKQFIALLEDRILMMSGQKQLYGTQIFVRTLEDGSKRQYLFPVEDPENINIRRAEMGMTTIEEYLETYSDNAVFDKDLTIKELQ